MTAIIKARPKIVWQIITDLNNYKDFMPNTCASLVVPAAKIQGILLQTPITAKQVEELIGPTPAPLPRVPGGKYVVYHYSDLDLPWPCADRWYITKNVMNETRAAQHYYHSSWSLVIGNVKEDSGGWIVEPYGVNLTRVIYRVATDPGGEIPGFLVKHGTCITLPDIIKAIRERAAKISRGKSGS
jgi:ribosome-associated toxin RatA of RatAB toxin-antitoxin module